jgi:ribosomal protein L40E
MNVMTIVIVALLIAPGVLAIVLEQTLFKNCPACGMASPNAATRCRYCHTDFPRKVRR